MEYDTNLIVIVVKTLLNLYFITGISGISILTLFTPKTFSRKISHHGRSVEEESKGKGNRLKEKEKEKSWLDQFLQLKISKNYFSVYYVISMLFGLPIVAFGYSDQAAASIAIVFDGLKGGGGFRGGQLAASLLFLLGSLDCLKLLFLLNTVRRFLETTLLFNSSTKMNIIHHLVGITFYPAIWLLLASSSIAVIQSEGIQIFNVLVLALMAVCMIQQFQCHLVMAQNKDKAKLPLAKSFWLFGYVICPNFLLECLIYLFLHLFLKSWESLLVVIFVLLNQGVSALDRREYYMASSGSSSSGGRSAGSTKKLDKSPLPTPKFAMIPFLL